MYRILSAVLKQISYILRFFLSKYRIHSVLFFKNRINDF